MARSAALTVVVTCKLDEVYFADWVALPADIQNWWDDQHAEPHCEGTGEIGTYCTNCPFCESFEVSNHET